VHEILSPTELTDIVFGFLPQLWI